MAPHATVATAARNPDATAAFDGLRNRSIKSPKATAMTAAIAIQPVIHRLSVAVSAAAAMSSTLANDRARTRFRGPSFVDFARMTVKRMDNVGIVVENLESAIEFFRVLGLELESRAMVEGEWAGRVTGLGDQQVEIAMMRTPDGHSRLEISRCLAPPVVADHRTAPVNALGYLRVMFAVDDLDETLARLGEQRAELVSSEIVQYEDMYRLCYIRGPEGLLLGLAQELR
jgi:catechol 2,3-dioxygenase-like lactoylglutathione lyase family enzyme